MKTILLLILLCVSSCLMTSEQTLPQETVIVAVTRTDGLCALSKVAIFDNEGSQYQAEGCSSGIVVLPPGRTFQWADSLGTEIIGFTIFIARE